MYTVKWNYNVSYYPEEQRIVFQHSQGTENEAEDLLEYFREVYPSKSWLELVSLVLPEIQQVDHPEQLKFYSI